MYIFFNSTIVLDVSIWMHEKNCSRYNVVPRVLILFSDLQIRTMDHEDVHRRVHHPLRDTAAHISLLLHDTEENTFLEFR